jgi:hypothetical protein
MSVREAQERISAHEFAEWIAFDAISPIGDRRRDLRMAIAAASNVNLWRGKDEDPVHVEDFVPTWEGPVTTETESAVDEDLQEREFLEAMGAVRKPRDQRW